VDRSFLVLLYCAESTIEDVTNIEDVTKFPRTKLAAGGRMASLSDRLRWRTGGKCFGRLSNSVPAPTTVKAATTKYEQDDEDDQKCVGIHGNLLREPEPTS
jgi:hypothetical protein